jgi:hypothetical protein
LTGFAARPAGGNKITVAAFIGHGNELEVSPITFGENP